MEFHRADSSILVRINLEKHPPKFLVTVLIEGVSKIQQDHLAHLSCIRKVLYFLNILLFLKRLLLGLVPNAISTKSLLVL